MGPGWDVYSHGGRKNVGLDAVAWATQMAEHGAGEILLTSMDRDGTKSGVGGWEVVFPAQGWDGVLNFPYPPKMKAENEVQEA